MTREQAGVGPVALVTTMALIRHRPQTREPYLASRHTGLSPAGVQTHTGCELDTGGAVETLAPSLHETGILRRAVNPKASSCADEHMAGAGIFTFTPPPVPPASRKDSG